MNSFRQYLVKEVEQKHIEKIKSATQEFEDSPGKAPFSHIFGDKARLRLSLTGDSEKIDEITAMIQSKMPEAKLDWQAGRVLKHNDRSQAWKDAGSIASALSKMKADKKYLDWFAQYMSLSELKRHELAHNNLVVVISRHPVDVLRMSDVGGITSCHSPEGGYFDCAIEDAQKGNLVAYLVRKDAKVPQKGEMFRDNDRLQAGDEDQMGVVGRLRIRRFLGYYKDEENKTRTIQAAIPEKRVYPDWMESFYQTVLTWARKSQPKLMAIPPENFVYFKQIGGHYFDTTPETLFRDLFDSDKIVDSIGPEGQRRMLAIGLEKLKNNYKLDHVKTEVIANNGEVKVQAEISFEINKESEEFDPRHVRRYMYEKLNNYAFDGDMRVNVTQGTIQLVYQVHTTTYRLDDCERFFQYLRDLNDKYKLFEEEAYLVVNPNEYIKKLLADSGLKYTKVTAEVEASSPYYLSIDITAFQEYHVPVKKIKEPGNAQELLDKFIKDSKENYRYQSHYHNSVFTGTIENGIITIRVGMTETAHDPEVVRKIIEQQKAKEGEEYNRNMHAITAAFIEHETMLDNTPLGKAIDHYFEKKKVIPKIIYYKIKGQKKDYDNVAYFSNGQLNLHMQIYVIGGGGTMMDKDLYSQKIQPELEKWLTKGDPDAVPRVNLNKIPELSKLLPQNTTADYELRVSQWGTEVTVIFPELFTNTDPQTIEKVIHDFLYLYQEQDRIRYAMAQWFWKRFNLDQHGQQHWKDYHYWNGPEHSGYKDDWKTPKDDWSKPYRPHDQFVSRADV
jgi:hypothetical protein